jgi:hypothetical protein
MSPTMSPHAIISSHYEHMEGTYAPGHHLRRPRNLTQSPPIPRSPPRTNRPGAREGGSRSLRPPAPPPHGRRIGLHLDNRGRLPCAAKHTGRRRLSLDFGPGTRHPSVDARTPRRHTAPSTTTTAAATRTPTTCGSTPPPTAAYAASVYAWTPARATSPRPNGCPTTDRPRTSWHHLPPSSGSAPGRLEPSPPWRDLVPDTRAPTEVQGSGCLRPPSPAVTRSQPVHDEVEASRLPRTRAHAAYRGVPETFDHTFWRATNNSLKLLKAFGRSKRDRVATVRTFQ